MDAIIREATTQFFNDAHKGAAWISKELGAEARLLARGVYKTRISELPFDYVLSVCGAWYYLYFPNREQQPYNILPHYYLLFTLQGMRDRSAPNNPLFTRSVELQYARTAEHIAEGMANALLHAERLAEVRWQTISDLDVFVDLARSAVQTAQQIGDIVLAVDWHGVGNAVARWLEKTYPQYYSHGAAFCVLTDTIRYNETRSREYHHPQRAWQTIHDKNLPPYFVTVLLRFYPKHLPITNTLFAFDVQCELSISSVTEISAQVELRAVGVPERDRWVATINRAGSTTEVARILADAIPQAVAQQLAPRWREVAEHGEQITRQPTIHDVNTLLHYSVALLCAESVGALLRRYRPFGFVQCWAEMDFYYDSLLPGEGKEDVTTALFKSCKIDIKVRYNWARREFTLPLAFFIHVEVMESKHRWVSVYCTVNARAKSQPEQSLLQHTHITLAQHGETFRNKQLHDLTNTDIHNLLVPIVNQLHKALEGNAEFLNLLLLAVDREWNACIGSEGAPPASVTTPKATGGDNANERANA